MSGVHAPGVQNLDDAMAAAHHTALAHAEATRAMREVRDDLRIGLALNMTTYRIEDESDKDLAELGELLDAQLNRWWIEAFLKGSYPESLMTFHEARLAKIIQPGDLAKLKVQTDFLGVNYYSDAFVGLPGPEDKPLVEEGLFPFPHRMNGSAPEPHTDMGWPVTPQGLEELLLRIASEWPEIEDIAITENGAAYDYEPDETGEVNDVRRVEYLLSHLAAAGRAIQKGAPLKSYYAWSLMDNFEWAEGYNKRFGLVHVNFKTLERTIKNSGVAYSQVIASSSRALATN
jgi:beta-glucosidase